MAWRTASLICTSKTFTKDGDFDVAAGPIQTHQGERDTHMTTVESVAIDAVRSGRHLVKAWPAAAVEHTSFFDKLIVATLSGRAAGWRVRNGFDSDFGRRPMSRPACGADRVRRRKR